LFNPKYNSKNRLKHSRGNANYRKAHLRILSHPLNHETQNSQSCEFSADQIFWPKKTASVRESSITAITKLLREEWDTCPSGEKVLQCLRENLEIIIEFLCNWLIVP
jgi:hypothetical protein